MKTKFMIALTILALVFAANIVSADTQTVIIKNGPTLISYTIETYSGGAEPDITTNTFTGADVMTLKGLGVPWAAWQLFSDNKKVIFSSDAFRLSEENSDLQTTLDKVSDDLVEARHETSSYQAFMWLIAMYTAVAIFVLSILLDSRSEALKRARAANQH